MRSYWHRSPFVPLRLISPAEVSYASSLICLEPHTISENVTTLSWTGFFGNQEIKLILKQLFQSKQGWVNLTLHGFDECAPTGTEHFTLYYGIFFYNFFFRLGMQQLCSIFLRSSVDYCVVTCKSPTNKIKWFDD